MAYCKVEMSDGKSELNHDMYGTDYVPSFTFRAECVIMKSINSLEIFNHNGGKYAL